MGNFQKKSGFLPRPPVSRRPPRPASPLYRASGARSGGPGRKSAGRPQWPRPGDRIRNSSKRTGSTSVIGIINIHSFSFLNSQFPFVCLSSNFPSSFPPPAGAGTRKRIGSFFKTNWSRPGRTEGMEVSGSAASTPRPPGSAPASTSVWQTTRAAFCSISGVSPPASPGPLPSSSSMDTPSAFAKGINLSVSGRAVFNSHLLTAWRETPHQLGQLFLGEAALRPQALNAFSNRHGSFHSFLPSMVSDFRLRGHQFGLGISATGGCTLDRVFKMRH